MTRPAPHCCKCNAVIFSEAEKISKADRGGRAAYICADCLEATSLDHEGERGTATASGYKYKLVLTIKEPSAELQAELLSAGYTRNVFSTEERAFYYSPVCCSLKPFSKKLKTIEKLISDGHGKIIEPLRFEIVTGRDVSVYLADYEIPLLYGLTNNAATLAQVMDGYLMSVYDIMHQEGADYLQFKAGFRNAEQVREWMNFCKRAAQIVEKAEAKHKAARTPYDQAVKAGKQLGNTLQKAAEKISR